jgi:transcriptional adapter 3
MSKNTSSKGKHKPGSKPGALPRSRNTTPLPNVRASVEPSAASASYFSKPLSALARKCDVTIEEILDRGGANQQVPSSASLISMREAIESKVLANVQKRCDVSNAALRELQGLKKNRPAHDREHERASRDSEDHRHKVKKHGKRAPEDERPLAVGAHGVARQDGVDLHKGECLLLSLSHCLEYVYVRVHSNALTMHNIDTASCFLHFAQSSV